MVYQISGKLILLLILLKCIIFADGLLTVHTTPDKIEIWIDDQYIGDSPIIGKKFKQGRYNLRIIDPIQHASLTEDIFIKDNDSLFIEKTIQSRYGKLQVISDPPGAKVFISTNLGETPLSNDFMNPGKYRIEIRLPGNNYQMSSSDIIIPKGETVKIDKELKKINLMNTKAILRIALGALSIGALIWAVVDQGNYKQYSLRASEANMSELRSQYQTKSGQAGLRRTIAVGIGITCIAGFETISFF